MKIGVLVGHSILKDGSCTSAGGYVQEYAYCKELAPLLSNKLKDNGKNQVDIIICPEFTFIKKSQERTYKLNKINGNGYDLIIELHLNCYDGSAKGTEVLYSSNRGKVYAQRVNDKLDDIFVDRDIKLRNDLYILRETDCAAILVEAFFCDNKEDYMKADEPHEKDLIARKIAEGILNKTINDIKPPATENTKRYKNCVLYGNDIDKVGAEIISWAKEDCIVKHVDNHVKWEATNLFTVGGSATEAMQKLNNGEKFGIIKGDNRYDTVRKCLEFVGK